MLRHDARLEIDSRPGEGALFHCVFPAARLCLPEAGETPDAMHNKSG
nr:hypothetical protein [Halomonas sp. EAR18]